MGELEAENCTYKDWNEVCIQLLLAFRDQSKKKGVQQKLEQLKQGIRLVALVLQMVVLEVI